MKKIVMFAAAVALSIPLFAENKVGKVTGIQVNDKTATINLAEGLINPFSEDFFSKSGESTVTVPIDVAVEFYFPKRPNAPEAPKAKDNDKREDKKMEPPKLEVKNLKVDQMVQVVYAQDGKTVEKIQVQPMMMGGPHPDMAKDDRKASDKNRNNPRKDQR